MRSENHGWGVGIVVVVEALSPMEFHSENEER